MKTITKRVLVVLLSGFMLSATVPAFAQIIILQTNLLTNSNFENSRQGWSLWGGYHRQETSGNKYIQLGSNNMTTESLSQAVYLGQYFPDDLELTFDYQISSTEYDCRFDKADVKIYRTDSLFGPYPINAREFIIDTIDLCHSNNTSGWVNRFYDLSDPALQAILGTDWYFGTNMSVSIEVYTDFNNASTFSIDNVELWAAPLTP